MKPALLCKISFTGHLAHIPVTKKDTPFFLLAFPFKILI